VSKAGHHKAKPGHDKVKLTLTVSRGDEVLIRPMRIEDIRLYRNMLDRTSADDLFLRFFSVSTARVLRAQSDRGE
jgi:hypothetical protein